MLAASASVSVCVCHNNYKRDLVIWPVHLIYSTVGFALCYNYVILNYCIRFVVLPCVRLSLNSCYKLCITNTGKDRKSCNRGLSKRLRVKDHSGNGRQ